MNTALRAVFWLLAFQLLAISSAVAEYRVYKLGVRYSANQQETEVLTSLDHLQYATYYRLTPNQQTRLIDHWMCRGRTSDFKRYCPKPVRPNRTLAESPKSQSSAAAPPQQQIPNVIQ
jgi:hypothetical protein